MSDYNVLEYGAAGDGTTNDAAAIQQAIEACAQACGGRVVLPAGRTYYSGSLILKAHVELHVEIGACLRASADGADYVEPFVPQGADPSYGGRPKLAFLYAKDAAYVTISGRGAIDGSSQAFQGEATRYHISGKTYPRPALIYLESCHHLSVTDITLRNSHFWTLHPAGCDDVLIAGVRILNSLDMANSDGIDPDHCRNVRIVNCHIEAADDCIVLKNTKALQSYGPTENVIISGCTLVSTSAAIKIGTESVSDFRNIIVSNCAISRSNRGLAIQLRDGGNVENVLYSDITIETRRFHEQWWGKAEPIYVTAFDRNEQTKAGTIRNVRFRNIVCRSENGVYISGWKDNAVEDIVLEQVSVEIVKWTKWRGGVYDRRPCVMEGLTQEENAGVYCAYARDVVLRNVKVRWAEELPDDYGPALKAVSVQQLKLDHFTGQAAHDGKPDHVIEP